MFSVGTLKNLNGRCSLSIRTSLVLPWVFLLVLQYGIDKQRKVFAASPDSLRAISRALKGKSDNLVGWIASVVQSAFSFHRSSLQVLGAFFVFSGAASLEKESTAGNQGQAGTVVPFLQSCPISST